MIGSLDLADLGQPYFETEGCRIYHLDCLDGLQALPKRVVNLTVTSPPYNIGKEYETPLPLPQYLNWCERWLSAIQDVSRENGTLWLNLGYVPVPDKAKALPLPYLLWEKIPFYLIQEVVWHYTAGVAGRKFFSPRNEKFLWLVNDPDDYTFNLDAVRDPNVKYPNQKKNGRLKVNPLGKNPGDVWVIPKVTSGRNRASRERTSHPAQFPKKVIARILKASSNRGDLVMDPFMGSGTTAVAALALDRQVIGFEIREDYCEIAAERIERFLKRREEQRAQQELFSGP